MPPRIDVTVQLTGGSGDLVTTISRTGVQPPSTDTPELPQSRTDITPTILSTVDSHTSDDTAVGSHPEFSVVQWVNRELEGRVRLIVFAKYSTESNVIDFGVSLVGEDNEQICFLVEARMNQQRGSAAQS